MSQILYIDAVGGAAGDMLAGAFLDLGWPFAELEALVEKLDFNGVSVYERQVEHMGLKARHIEVEVKEDQPHRGLSQVLEMLSPLPKEVAEPAKRVFKRLAQVEANIHGTTTDKVHFHEVGACDALVDVIAFCGGLAWLKPKRIVCSPLPLGRGFVNCAHGKIPLPAPAVLGLIKGVPITSWPANEETVTPTGAVLVTTFADSYGSFPEMRIDNQGTGGGSRPSTVGPNIVRLIAGKGEILPEARQVIEISCNLDDQSPEDLPMVLDRFMKAGALDACAAPLYMKKGRPGLQLVVSSSPDKVEELARLVLEQTTSLGVRLNRTERRCMPREIVSVETQWGTARVKRTMVNDIWRMHPEADDVLRICQQTGLAPFLVRQGIISALEKQES